LLLVFDCTVLIDLREGGVLSDLARLPHDLFVCDVNAEELRKKSKKRWKRHLKEAGVEVRELPPEGMVRLLDLAGRHRSPCQEDLFALALALWLEGTLLTGDADLRRAAEAERCPVHGTLWLLDEMVRQGIIQATAADAALAKMLKADRRIPRVLARKYREMWR